MTKKDELIIEKNKLEAKIKSMYIEGAIYLFIMFFTLTTIFIPIILILIVIVRGQKLAEIKSELSKINIKLG